MAATLALAACGGSSSPSSGPTRLSAATTAPSSSPSGVTGGSEAGESESAAAESAYRAFWPVLATFAQKPEGRWRAVLGEVAVDPQLGLTIALSREQRRNGVKVYGQPRPRAPRVTVGAGGTATVQDCADFSATGQADARTGHRRTVGVARNPVRVAMRKSVDGRWRVSEVTYPGGRC